MTRVELIVILVLPFENNSTSITQYRKVFSELVMMDKVIRIATCHKPKKLVSLAKERGNDSCGAALDTTNEDIFNLLPDVTQFGFELSHDSAIMLANLVCVHPHTDPSVGILKTSHAAFGLLSGGKDLRLFVRDGDEWIVTEMRPGNWVIFEDNKEHMVMAESKWTGVSFQVKEIDA